MASKPTDYSILCNIDSVMELLKQDGLMLEFIHPDLQDLKDVVEAAIEQNPKAFRFASERLRSDRDLVLFTARRFGGCLWNTSRELLDDEEVVRAAMSNDPSAFAAASKRIQEQPEFIRSAILADGMLIRHVDKNSPILAECIEEVIAKTPTAIGPGSVEVREAGPREEWSRVRAFGNRTSGQRGTPPVGDQNVSDGTRQCQSETPIKSFDHSRGCETEWTRFDARPRQSSRRS